MSRLRPPKTAECDGCARLKARLGKAQEQARRLRSEAASLRQEIADLKDQLATSEQLRAEQGAMVVSQQEQIEALEREAHRQAAVFRVEDCKRKPESEKKKPGQKKGHRGSYRRRPEPPEITDTVEVPLDCCPHCQGPVGDVKPLVQYIDDLIVVPRRLELTTYVGVCSCCGAVRSTHPEQVSTAAGSAGTHLGWRALALGAVLNKQYGITTRNVCDILGLLGLSLTAGGLVGALKRVADKLEPYMDQVREGLRQSAVVHADETGWWVAGQSRWLWDFTNERYTIYLIGSRASAMVQEVLGDHFSGVLVSDCLVVYDAYPCRKSKCVAHHLRAIDKALKLAPDSAYLRNLKYLFKASIVLHNLRQYMGDDYWIRVAAISQNLSAALDSKPLHPAEIAVQNRLVKQRPHLLTFLISPEVDPTNNHAERMLRPAISTRKLSTGHKTLQGVRTFEILKSLAVTCRQQGRSFADLVGGVMSFDLPPPDPLFVKPAQP